MVAGLATKETIIVPDAKLEGAGIKIILGEATQIDSDKKQVRLGNGESLGYSKLFLATGSSSFLPPIY